MSNAPVTVPGGTGYNDLVGDNVITADQTSGADLVTINAANGTDTIIGGGGDLIVDASANALSVEIAPAMGGTTSIVGGSGTLLVDPDGLGNEGFLTVQLGGGAATVNASSGGTNVTAGTGPLTIYTEDANLAISAPGGFPTLEWHPAYGEEIDITTDSGTGVTTVADVTTGITAALSANGIVVDASVGGTFGDFVGEQTINLGATAATVTASQGADTINAGTGDLTVDASGNGNSIVVNGGTGALTFSAGVGDATISGGSSTTIVTGGTGTIALAQHGYTVINARDGAITVTSDGSTLSVTGEDGFSSTNWNVASGDTVTITTDLALHTTTLWDSVTGAQTVLAGGFATNYINGYIGGTVYDLPDHNVINLMGGPVTVVASQGTDTINGGAMPGDMTVNATGNANPVVVNAGIMGTLTFTGGGGPATVTGSYMGTTINGGMGGTVLNQHGNATIHAGSGPITVNADGTSLTVIGADGTSNGSWNFTPGDVVTISSVGAITTVSDPNGSLSYTLPDIIPPTLTIGPINSGAVLNANQATAGFIISGTTDAEVGQTVTVRIVDGSSATVWTDTASVLAGGTWSLAVSSGDATTLLDDSYTVTADVDDLAGNHAIKASQPLTVDETAPVVMVNTIASDNVLNATEAAAGLTIGGTSDAEVGQTITVTIVDGSSATVWSDTASVQAGGLWSLTVPSGDATALLDGSYTVSASVADVAGNLSSPASRPLTVDETAPTVTVNPITQPLNALGAMTGLTIGGTSDAEVGQTITVTIVDGSSATVWSDTASVQAGGLWSLTVPSGDATALLDGSYTVSASVADVAGNLSSPASRPLTVDETAPTVTVNPITQPLNALGAMTGLTIGGTSDAEVGQTITVTIVDGSSATVWSDTASVQAGGLWSLTVPSGDATALLDGSYTVSASVADVAGNLSSPASRPLTVDETAPTVTVNPITQPLNALGAMTGLTIGGTSDAEVGQTITVTIVDGSSATVWSDTASVQAGGLWSLTVPSGDATALLDGSYTVSASVADVAGNLSSPASRPLTVDETAPTITISGTSATTNQLVQLVSGTADLSTAGQIVTVWDNGAPVTTTTVQLNGTWSVPIPLMVEGAHNLTASVNDPAGNTGTSAAVTYTLDTTPPTVAIDPLDPVNAAATAAGFPITGTTNAEDDQTVTIRILDSASNPVGLPYQATVLGGNWSVTVPSGNATALLDGSYTVTASVTDVAGNPSSPASQPFTVDQTAPVVAIIGPGGLVNQATQIVSGIADPLDVGRIVTVMEGGTALGVATVGGGGVWSTAVTLSGDGAHSLTATETDLAGNTGTSAAVTYTLDTTAPAVTIFGTGGPTNQTAQVVGGTGESGASVTVWDGMTSVGSALVDLNGNWSTSVNLTGEGPHSLTATGTDAAGNTGSGGASVDYTLDTAAAAVAITSLGRLTNQAMQTVSGTVDPTEAGATVTVWDGSTVLGTATAASDGRWSATVVLAGDGAHSLMASETDSAGNTGISNAVIYTLDTTPVTSSVNSNPYAGAIGQQLAGLLGSLGALSYFGPNQPIPDASTGSPALLISSNDGSPVTVPGGVSVVRNQASGIDLQGSGRANQVVVSSVGFTYHSNGGSGVVLADDAQAGGPAGNSNIVLARSGGGDFVISTGSGDDTVDAASGNVSVAAGGGQNMIWLGSGDALVTSSGADTVVSGTGAATVHATAGSEALVFGGASTLTFMGDSGAATVVGGTGSTNLVAGSGNAVFWGSENGGNTMYAGTGAATLVGGGSGNVIHAAGSADLLLVAGSGNSTLVGGSATGNNFYWGSQGDDVISADQGNDTIIGGPGHDTVQAGGGNALIFGGVDGTTFVAGSGTANIVSGNGGANTFAFINGQAGGTEIIWGFRTGTDHLSLQGYGANELANATAGAQGYGPGTQIGLSDGTKIVFGDIASLKGAALS